MRKDRSRMTVYCHDAERDGFMVMKKTRLYLLLSLYKGVYSIQKRDMQSSREKVRIHNNEQVGQEWSFRN